MTTLLFQAVRDTLGTLLADSKYLGAQPGIIAALHTWSQTLVLHPHLHCLVTGGGLTPAGQWVAVRHGVLLPARVVMAVVLGKMVAAIRQTLVRGALALPEPMRPQQVLNLLNRLGHPTKTRWNVRIMERYRHGAGVVTYLACYLRGGPIKNGRLVAWDGDRVSFTCRARPEEADGGVSSPPRPTVGGAGFLPRWLLHVPVPQTRVVRSYGLYHPTHAEALAVCRTALGQAPVEVPVARDWQTVCAQRGDLPPECCPTCGQFLVCTAVIPRAGTPPLVLAEKRAGWAWDCRGGLPGAWCAGWRLACGGCWRAAGCRGAQGAQGARPLRRAPVDGAYGGGARPDDGRGASRKLHSVRLAKLGQAASVRGPSN